MIVGKNLPVAILKIALKRMACLKLLLALYYQLLYKEGCGISEISALQLQLFFHRQIYEAGHLDATGLTSDSLTRLTLH